MRNRKETKKYEMLYKKLGYRFNDERLLINALTRKSAINEGKQKSGINTNPRLELMGDRIIDTAIVDILQHLHPNWNTGTLTKVKSHYVNNNGPLAKIAMSLGLDQLLIMGNGETTRKVNLNTKALSDATEALFGAIFLDSHKDYSTLRKLVRKHWAPLGLLKTDQQNKNPQVKSPAVSRGVKLRNKSYGSVVKTPTWEDSINGKLYQAIFSGDIGGIRKYLDLGGNANGGYLTFEYDSGDSLYRPYLSNIIGSSRPDRVSIVKLLLKHGADPNSQESYYSYPTLNSGEYKDYTKNTPLHYLVDRRDYSILTRDDNLKIAKLLIQNGAKPLLKNDLGQSSIERIKFYLNFARTLLKRAREKGKLGSREEASLDKCLMHAVDQSLVSLLSLFCSEHLPESWIINYRKEAKSLLEDRGLLGIEMLMSPLPPWLVNNGPVEANDTPSTCTIL